MSRRQASGAVDHRRQMTHRRPHPRSVWVGAPAGLGEPASVVVLQVVAAVVVVVLVLAAQQPGHDRQVVARDRGLPGARRHPRPDRGPQPRHQTDQTRHMWLPQPERLRKAHYVAQRGPLKCEEPTKTPSRDVTATSVTTAFRKPSAGSERPEVSSPLRRCLPSGMRRASAVARFKSDIPRLVADRLLPTPGR